MKDKYQPPFTITPEILILVSEISEALGRLAVLHKSSDSLRLRRTNRIRTIQGSLAIEGNTLNEDQITAILNGKRVLAPAKEVQEVRNALLAYEQMNEWKPHFSSDLLAAHGVLMLGLVDAPGKFRTGSVGIMKGKSVIHLAPPADIVPALTRNLLHWLKTSKDQPLIASSVFHYEFEFIHPFPDGNGRLGRLWQTLILTQWNPLFAFMPIETIIHHNQREYYKAINQSTLNGNSTVFIEFMLRMILSAVQETLNASEKMSEKMSEKILQLLKDGSSQTIAEIALKLNISTRTVERNLKILQEQGKLLRVGPAKGGTWKVL